MTWTRRPRSSTPPSRWRRVQRLAFRTSAAVVLALSMTSGHDAAMSPAGALFDRCEPKAPAPHDPRDGAAGMVAQQPEQLTTAEAFGASSSPSSLFAKYGTAGLWWPTYDPGCNPATEASMTIGTSIGDWGQQVSNFFQNATAAARSWAWRNDWLAPLDRTVERFNESLMGNYTGPLLGLGLVVAGLFIVHRGRRAELSESANHALWGIGIVVLGVCALSAPTRLGNTIDYYGVGSAGAVERAMGGQDITNPPTRLTMAAAHPNTCEGKGGLTGCYEGAQPGGVIVPDQLPKVQSSDDPLVGLINRDVAYRQWLIGMFGSADSATARRFGPKFYEAMALSWEDVRKPPAELEKIKEKKMARFKDLAGKLHEADHDAYRVMQGKTAFSDRVVTGWLTALMAGIATLFAAIAGVAVLLARLMIRGGVMALPIIVPFGLIRTYRGAVTALFKMIATAIITAVMFTIASGLMTRLTTALLESPGHLRSWPAFTY